MNPRIQGVTLIEVIMALGILAVAILGVMAVFISGLKLSKSSEQVTTASTVGQEFLELTKVRGYDGLMVGKFDGIVATPADPSTGFPVSPYPSVKRDHKDYILVVDCTDITPTIRGVKVDVYWDVKLGAKATFYTRVHK